jgi:hypothetical protein
MKKYADADSDRGALIASHTPLPKKWQEICGFEGGRVAFDDCTTHFWNNLG